MYILINFLYIFHIFRLIDNLNLMFYVYTYDIICVNILFYTEMKP